MKLQQHGHWPMLTIHLSGSLIEELPACLLLCGQAYRGCPAWINIPELFEMKMIIGTPMINIKG